MGERRGGASLGLNIEALSEGPAQLELEAGIPGFYPHASPRRQGTFEGEL